MFAGRDSNTGKSHSLPDRIDSLCLRAINWAKCVLTYPLPLYLGQVGCPRIIKLRSSIQGTQSCVGKRLISGVVCSGCQRRPSLRSAWPSPYSAFPLTRATWELPPTSTCLPPSTVSCRQGPLADCMPRTWSNLVMLGHSKRRCDGGALITSGTSKVAGEIDIP